MRMALSTTQKGISTRERDAAQAGLSGDLSALMGRGTESPLSRRMRGKWPLEPQGEETPPISREKRGEENFSVRINQPAPYQKSKTP